MASLGKELHDFWKGVAARGRGFPEGVALASDERGLSSALPFTTWVTMRRLYDFSLFSFLI